MQGWSQFELHENNRNVRKQKKQIQTVQFLIPITMRRQKQKYKFDKTTSRCQHLDKHENR